MTGSVREIASLGRGKRRRLVQRPKSKAQSDEHELHPQIARIRADERERRMVSREGGTPKKGSWWRDAPNNPRDAGATPENRSRLYRLGPGFHAQVVDFPHIARGKMFLRTENQMGGED
jgi:hypothetical protein